jgi:amidase
MTQLHDLTATEQLAQLRAGAVSSRELTAHYLDRIERLDSSLRAFVTVFAEESLTAAAAADATPSEGLLHGLPLALKDMHASAGLRTTFGCAVFNDLVPPTDAPAIANLRAAGAVVIGKTNVPEFGPTCYTDSAVGGVTVTPYGSGLSASGSSGGAASAVAAGLVGLAHGSDGLGSIRTPAANCGLVGFKATRGRVAGSGLGWLALAVEGPLARTVADAALFLDAMGGPAASDQWRVPVPSSDAFRKAASTRPDRPLRVGVLLENGLDVAVDKACLAAVERTVAVLGDLGHQVEEVQTGLLPASSSLRPAVKAVLSSSIGMIVSGVIPSEQHDQLMPYTRWLASQEVSGVELAQAHSVLAAAAISFTSLLSGYDVVLSPTTTAPPLPTSELRQDDGPASLEAMARWSAYTPAANIAGTPAVSLPVHMTDDGLPIGVQLSGPACSDELLISLSAQLEEAFGWVEVHPPLW